MSDDEETLKVSKKRRKLNKNEFIDDEAELSGDDQVSEDEADNSDDDVLDLDLVDQDAPELDSDQEEEVRGFYHKQLESEDKRAVLLLQEQLEDKDVSIGQRRRRKFRWQTKELMENSLKRHYEPDDEDSQDYDEDDDTDDEIVFVSPKLKRSADESLIIGSTKVVTTKIDRTNNSETVDLIDELSECCSSGSLDKTATKHVPVKSFNDEPNSNTVTSRSTARSAASTNTTASDLNRYILRDRETLEALSTKEVIVTSREKRDRNVQREIKRVLQSKSIFDQLYS